ncbi:MAG TPA: hypothetical protein VEK57_27120 [Thermoanaerobaculia bacterium]|nr:hypothetical protein [Thermoanaerobaculia bacterium]
MRVLRRSTYALFLSAVIAFPALAQKTVRFTKLPRATLRELAAVQMPPPLPRENRHEKKRAAMVDLGRRIRVDAAEAKAEAVTTPVIIPAPPIAVGFASDRSETLSPADSSGAVSRTHVVSASNAGIVIHNRGGAQVEQLTLSQFWRNSNTVAEFYDPRLVYDAAADRWLTSAIRQETDLMLAVSATGDPTGAWIRYEVRIPGCDFTRLALTRDTVLVSTILPDGPSVLFSFDKTELYSDSADLDARSYNTSTFSMPVTSPDSPVEYLAEITSTSKLRVSRLDRLPEGTRVFDPGFQFNFFDGDLAPQAGTMNVLDLGFGDIQAAVYRGGWLYAVNRIGSNDFTNDDNALVWWKVDPEGDRGAEIGIIDGEGETMFAYPSLAVNRAGAMLLSYCVLDKSIYPSAVYVYRDPAGRMSLPATIRTGDTPVLTTDRWGDYTTVVEDPLNDHDFWVVQIYASRNNWQTWWANVRVPPARSRSVRK